MPTANGCSYRLRMLPMLSDLVPIMLALSVASERLVTIFKTVFPWLAVESRSPGQEIDLTADRRRRLSVLAIAFAAKTQRAGYRVRGFLSERGVIGFQGQNP
jgi:hypothetical protein